MHLTHPKGKSIPPTATPIRPRVHYTRRRIAPRSSLALPLPPAPRHRVTHAAPLAWSSSAPPTNALRRAAVVFARVSQHTWLSHQCFLLVPRTGLLLPALPPRHTPHAPEGGSPFHQQPRPCGSLPPPVSVHAPRSALTRCSCRPDAAQTPAPLVISRAFPSTRASRRLISRPSH